MTYVEPSDAWAPDDEQMLQKFAAHSSDLDSFVPTHFPAKLARYVLILRGRETDLRAENEKLKAQIVTVGERAKWLAENLIDADGMHGLYELDKLLEKFKAEHPEAPAP
jgi:hypothetical protein